MIDKPTRSGIAAGAVLLGLALLCVMPSDAGQSAASVDERLREHMGFSRGDLRALNAGAAVLRSLETPIREELAYVGAVHVDVPAARFIEQFRDIERFEAGPGIPQIGRFSSPPVLEDLASLRWPATDLTTLAQCRPGDCDVKLSAASMERFRDEVEWPSPGAPAGTDRVAREMLLELVRAYQADGNVALGLYDDGDEPLSAAVEVRALFASGNPLPVPVPELLVYLSEYPNRRPKGAEDFFYWTVVDFGLKPTVRVSHVTLYPLDVIKSAYVIAIKQLYASHYFHTTLELRFLLDDDERNGRAGTTLISIIRSRSDGMTGFRGLFLRPVISRRSRNAVRAYLEQVKLQVEHLTAQP